MTISTDCRWKKGNRGMIAIIVGVLTMTAWSVVGQENTNKPNDAFMISLQNETVVDHMKLKAPAIKYALKEALAEMKVADMEVKAFAERKGSERVKEHFWSVSETVETNGIVIIRRADYFSETGPVCAGGKRVFRDKTYQEELKDQSYEFYYYENGNIKRFLTRSERPWKMLEFYQSGRIKEFGVVENNKTVVELRCSEDGSVKCEKVKGEQGKGSARQYVP